MAGGAPTKYEDEYAEQAYKLCLLGATDATLADFFQVDESTINNWKIAHPEFLESLKRGKYYADSKIAKSLYDRALGMTVVNQQAIKLTTKTFNQATKQSEQTEKIEIVDLNQEIPPDTVAAIFWLKNRQPKEWRDKVETSNTNLNGELSPEQVNIIIHPMGGDDKPLPTDENDVDTSREKIK